MSVEGASEPVCARHPDRVTYVLCNRCGNGICTDCMVPAPVGFQCPDCVRAARGHVRSVRVLLDQPPRVTQAIIGFCVAVQVLGMLGIGTRTGWVQEFSLFPARVAVYGEYWRFVTAIFVHAGLFHLGMNMLLLWMMGRTLEPALGRTRFLLLFLLAGAGGTMASYWFNDPMSAGIGASGAIFGLFAGVFVLGREVRVNTQEIVGVIGINLVLGFIIPGVDWRAHLGGLLIGAVAGWALLPNRHKVAQVVVPLLIVAALSGLQVLRTDALLQMYAQAVTQVIHT